MHDLAAGVKTFQQEVFPAKAPLFAGLAGRHRPTTLFISCSDARVVPELITHSEPGELFVIRTVGNLVPAHAPGGDGVASGIEYAVEVLGVTGIVVCGHSGCGAMTALADGHEMTALPMTAGWLRHAEAARPDTAPEGAEPDGDADQVAAWVRRNVIAQLANLATHPSVARALRRHAVSLHGWVYDIATGTVEELDPASGRPEPVAP
ncbi:carbonic anhydrase [Streptomyces sp. NPDC048644]|uniref:carbonic anhydrase n=1 Tax=Streptomyces sp. NPDC048644 TaxID=3365582 RepID=UPI003711FDB8